MKTTSSLAIALLISTILNILFLFAGFLFFNRKGGIFYVKTKLNNTLNPQKAAIKIANPNYYFHQSSLFEVLPKSDSEIVFLGDSITDECEWAELLKNPNIKNRGISGDTTSGLLNRLDNILESKPKQIFLMIGINDFIHYQKSAEEVFEDSKKILTKIQQKSPNTEIFIQSVLPVNQTKYKIKVDNNKVIKLNSYLQGVAKELSLQYIDLFSLLADSQNQLDSAYTLDGIHLNGLAYSVWKQAIEKYI